MRFSPRLAFLTLICSALVVGLSFAQPPRPSEPQPKAGQPNAAASGEAIPPQPIVRRVVVVVLPPIPASAVCCPAPRRCGFLSRLCGKCCPSDCDSFVSYGPSCRGVCDTSAYWNYALGYYLPTNPYVPYRIELNPQPLPPRKDEFRNPPRPITPERTATSLFQEGVSFYWHGDAATALDLIMTAVERDPQDAAAWYFKALTERSLGRLTEAKESVLRGAALETLNRPATSPLGVTLERVQGPDRQFLRSAMTADLTYEKAQEIASAPVKSNKPVATK